MIKASIPLSMAREGPFDVWGSLLIEFAFISAYTAGIRLMIEVQLAFLRGDEAGTDRILSA